jgi:hypothetical protein
MDRVERGEVFNVGNPQLIVEPTSPHQAAIEASNE